METKQATGPTSHAQGGESTLAPGLRQVLITGGGRGIGQAVAEALLRAGGRVVVTGRRVERLEALASAWPGRAFALPCDLTSPTARTGLVARARDLLGGLDGFVASAGVVSHQPLGHIDESALREQLEVNLVAPLRLGEEALSVLEPGGGMVFISSNVAHRPIDTTAVYSASKAGVLSVMKSLAMAGAPRRIRANAVSPGAVDTDMVRELRLPPGAPEPSPAEREALLERQLSSLHQLHPLGRMGTPADVVQAVLHLLQAPWTTGSELVVDGGLLLRG
ncbi:SDR family NAD(P)-dependent oxidoreductase [Hyalangium gracile]|uniref:SDR family NAD(P)-dependent oxidoreductase n=1 Tax=Hyalangium gracile TaxID=394092 RepID=UPI001CCF42EF|nr:SDR family oxidoreductase [Hyalangium gracile]